MKLITLSLLVLCTVARSQPIDLSVAVAHNRYTDADFGIGLSFPAGWQVRGATRWGERREQNTVMLQPLWPSEAQPAVYYQRYPADTPTPITDHEAYFRRAAGQKEASRRQGMPDYKNVADSFALRTIAGRPSCSYLATFTSGSRKMAEYIVRVAGEKSYVMFFTMGPAEEIEAVRADIDKMAESVTLP